MGRCGNTQSYTIILSSLIHYMHLVSSPGSPDILQWPGWVGGWVGPGNEANTLTVESQVLSSCCATCNTETINTCSQGATLRRHASVRFNHKSSSTVNQYSHKLQLLYKQSLLRQAHVRFSQHLYTYIPDSKLAYRLSNWPLLSTHTKRKYQDLQDNLTP